MKLRTTGLWAIVIGYWTVVAVAVVLCVYWLGTVIAKVLMGN